MEPLLNYKEMIGKSPTYLTLSNEKNKKIDLKYNPQSFQNFGIGRQVICLILGR
jgi:hypothetical protein